MLRTIRFVRQGVHTPRLGFVDGDNVYDITSLVDSWSDPMPLWNALAALCVPLEQGFESLRRGLVESYSQIQRDGRLLTPVAAPEVWAAGVTYERSREARNAETKVKDSVYDRVYGAERPELFFKATERRLVCPGESLRLRSDSRWMVPEPELGVVLSKSGDLVGFTVGNDLSSRDIEGENPLYLPQAKVFAGSCSIGPAVLWNTHDVDPASWSISLTIHRDGETAFFGEVPFSQLRRSIDELVSYLMRDNEILDGTVLLTGTGIVPPDDFTLSPGDVVEISVPQIGVLSNPIELSLP